MKAYVTPIPTTLSRGIHRVADALARYCPEDVEITADYDQADFLVCHMIGQEGWAEHLKRFSVGNRRYAVFQYCLRTTTTPNAFEWALIWKHAAVVASYYNLKAISDLPSEKFLHTALGVDTSIFKPPTEPVKEPYLVGTSGYVDGMEIIGEWAWVAGANGGRMFHLGPHLKLPNAAVQYRLGITDEELAGFWGRCRYVSGLRRGEGFELPAYEGLACGARPVMFDREDARQWLGNYAEYIGEGDDASIRWQLDTLVRGRYRPVTPDEIIWAKEQFSWKAMAEKFWAAIPR